ncbi:MAG: hypothetical protein L3J69_12165 [Desulfobacula sp.]|nr:hypothetical protein [Desulfobacula sp.]
MRGDSSQAYKTGELLVREGLIHQEDIGTALAIQEKRNASVTLNKTRFIGMILCDLNLITPVDNYTVLHKNNKLITLSSALVQKEIISLEKMQTIEAQSLREDLPLISLLLKTDVVTMQVMQQVLFDLFHIPFRSISDFIFDDDHQPLLLQIIDSRMAKENGIIPLVLKDNTVLFGITAPENLLLIHQLNQQFPQYRFKALFIPFSGFSWFHEIIYKISKQEKQNSDTHATRGREVFPDTAVTKGYEKQVDLSLLLGHKAAIFDPKDQWSTIQTFYNRYEMLRTMLGHPETGDRQSEFTSFIQQAHKKITSEGQNPDVEFSFQKQGRDVIILARPKE